MIHGRRFCPLAALLLASVGIGCVSDGKHSEGLPGLRWVMRSDIPESRRDLKQPVQLDLTYAQWQEQLGNLPEAEQSYRRALKHDPRSLDALIGLARLEQLAGRSQEAEQAYRRAVESAPENAQALDALGQFYAAERRWPDAIALLQRAVQAEPDDPLYRHHYAVALARSGDVRRAFVEFSRAVGEAEAHYNVGYLLYEQGRYDLAEREFLQAMAIRPDLAEARRMLDELRRERGVAPQMARNSASPVIQTAATVPGEHRGTMPTGVGALRASPVTPSVPLQPLKTETVISHPSHSSPNWEAPLRRDPASIFAEQMRNQTPLPQ